MTPAERHGGASISESVNRCGLVHYETQAQLIAQFELRHAYLDEVECSLHCSNRFCQGEVRISLIHDEKNEGFVGGMA
jgi:hypothetical protein